jgi:hypothetical protein
MECRSGCGACCVAPSINAPLPGMPQGKPAGVRCVPSAEMYGGNQAEAMQFLVGLDRLTRPDDGLDERR